VPPPQGVPARVNVPQATPGGPQTTADVPEATEPPDATLAPLLDRVADLIQQKAASALSRQNRALSMIANQHSRSPAVRTNLASASRELEQVQTALAEIEASGTHSQLATVIGDTTSLRGLITALGNLSAALDSVSDPSTLPQLTEPPRSAQASVQQWISECSQRIAELRKRIPAAS
jgi:hypothetical protein